MLESVINQNKEKINSWIDCFMSKSRNYGMVNVTSFSAGKLLAYKYGLDHKDQLIKHVNQRKDTYLSLNAFKDGVRRTDHLVQIRNIVVDLDFYKLAEYQNKTLIEVKSLVLESGH